MVSINLLQRHNLDKEYDTIVSVMANCPGHKVEDIDRGIKLLEESNLREIRSFNKYGEESGLLIFAKEVLQGNFDISYYMGGIISDVKEIHDKSDIVNEST